jgi:hypothetical protein
VTADQQQHEHDHGAAESHAHDDHLGTGQTDQVQSLGSCIGALSCSRSTLLGFGGGPGGGGSEYEGGWN